MRWGVDINCLDCKYYDRNSMGICEGFPSGIPLAVNSGAVSHNKPLPGQKNKIVFEPISKTKVTETKSYGKRRTFYKAKPTMTAAARELATGEMVDKVKAQAFVGYRRLEVGLENRVMGLMRQYEAGKITIGQLEWALKREFAAGYQEAYGLGQRSVGYTGDLADQDLAYLRGFRQSENVFLSKFMSAVDADELVMDKYDRLRMYVDTVRSVFDHARVEAAPETVEIYWVPSRGAKHCVDCLRLALGSPYTKETLPSTPRAGDTRCISNCQCSLMVRFKKPEVEEPDLVPAPGVKPPGEEYELQPELYSKFKGQVPEFRFFMDKNLGDPQAARQEFVAAVKKAKVGFTPSNYDDPFNQRFFKSNRLWLDVQKIKEMEKAVDPMGVEGKTLRKKRQDLMKELLAVNQKLKNDGLRWIRPDGYGGYVVGADGKPTILFPKG